LLLGHWTLPPRADGHAKLKRAQSSAKFCATTLHDDYDPGDPRSLTVCASGRRFNQRLNLRTCEDEQSGSAAWKLSTNKTGASLLSRILTCSSRSPIRLPTFHSQRAAHQADESQRAPSTADTSREILIARSRPHADGGRQPGATTHSLRPLRPSPCSRRSL